VSALLPAPYLEKIITVKVFEYLACEKPVVAALSGETARVIRDSGGGIVVPPNDPRAMADALLSLYHDPQRRNAMGKRGRAYVEHNFSRTIWAQVLEQILREMFVGTQKDSSLSRTGKSQYLEEPIQG
jgi:glycosyltransferase involved in cell wall biosynthesis